VAFYPAGVYAFDHRQRPFVRLGFARCSEAELRRAVAILAATLP